jgi:predicted kinase
MITESFKKRMMELAGFKQKEIIFLVGMPGSGKSTYIKKLKNRMPEKEYIVASHDDILMNLASKEGMKYDDAYKFFNFQEQIYPEFINTIKKSFKKGRNVIIDCTNLKRGDRKDVLDLVPNDYKKIAVIFNVNPEELKRRLDKRSKETGKTIPDEVIDKMRNWYIPPSKEEGFDKIITL